MAAVLLVENSTGSELPSTGGILNITGNGIIGYITIEKIKVELLL